MAKDRVVRKPLCQATSEQSLKEGLWPVKSRSHGTGVGMLGAQGDEAAGVE